MPNAALLWGGGIGLGHAIVLTAADKSSANSPYNTMSAGEAFAAVAASGMLYGAIIGAIVGRERWETFDLPVRTSLQVQPGHVSATFGFNY